MARNEGRQLCRLRAVTRGQSDQVPDAAVQAFEEAGRMMDRPDAFEDRTLAVDGEAFRALTGFSPNDGDFISSEAVRRSAEAATPARTSALGNARSALRNDYVALGVFLRVCAAHSLGLKADLLSARRRR